MPRKGHMELSLRAAVSPNGGGFLRALCVVARVVLYPQQVSRGWNTASALPTVPASQGMGTGDKVSWCSFVSRPCPCQTEAMLRGYLWRGTNRIRGELCLDLVLGPLWGRRLGLNRGLLERFQYDLMPLKQKEPAAPKEGPSSRGVQEGLEASLAMVQFSQGSRTAMS